MSTGMASLKGVSVSADWCGFVVWGFYGSGVEYKVDSQLIHRRV